MADHGDSLAVEQREPIGVTLWVHLDHLVGAVGAWQRITAPHHADPVHKVAKFAEEAGEVVGAVVKLQEGRRDLQDVADEIGDAVICLAGLCALLGISFSDAVSRRWNDDVRWRRGQATNGAPTVPPEVPT